MRFVQREAPCGTTLGKSVNSEESLSWLPEPRLGSRRRLRRVRMDRQLMFWTRTCGGTVCVRTPANPLLSVCSGARVLSSAAGLVPACRELGGRWPCMTHIGDGRCVEHLPAQFLPSAEPSSHSLRPGVVGMTVRTFAARQVGSAAVRAVLHDWNRSAGNRGSRGAYAPREISAVGHSRQRRAASLTSAPHGARPPRAV